MSGSETEHLAGLELVVWMQIVSKDTQGCVPDVNHGQGSRPIVYSDGQNPTDQFESLQAHDVHYLLFN